jgi:BA14K-like protein
MRIILAAVGALGISLIGVAGVSAIPINAASIDAATGANSSIIKVTSGGGHHFGRWPSCEHLRSYNPATKTFIGSNGKRHPCVPPRS